MTISADAGALAGNVARPRTVHPAIVMALGAALATALLVATFHGVDGARIVTLIRGVGAGAPLLLGPSLAALLLETHAWQTAMAVSGVGVRFGGLLAVRVASESVGAVLPLGPVWADAMKPPLLKERCGVPLPEGVAAIAIRKYVLVFSQAGYLLTAFLVARAAVGEGLSRRTGIPWLSFAPLAAAFALAAVALSTRALLRGGSALRRLFAAALRLGFAPLSTLVRRAEGAARGVDAAAAAFFGAAPRTHLRPLAACYGAWLLESVEAWLVLRALGTHLSWGDVAGVEALVALSRHLLPFVPGGLGVQELGYTVLLGSLGCDAELSLSLSLMKRIRELFWFVVGSAELLRCGLVRMRARSGWVCTGSPLPIVICSSVTDGSSRDPALAPDAFVATSMPSSAFASFTRGPARRHARVRS